jgi:hypothetical protein
MVFAVYTKEGKFAPVGEYDGPGSIIFFYNCCVALLYVLIAIRQSAKESMPPRLNRGGMNLQTRFVSDKMVE